MSDPFIGEIRSFAINYCPEGWLVCAGGTYAISQYQALFAVIGTRFGGDGKTSFCVPNLMERAVIGPGTAAIGGTVNRQFSTAYGEQTVSLSLDQLPNHTHQLQHKGGLYAIKTAGPSNTSNLGNLNVDKNSTLVNMLQDNTRTPNTTLDTRTLGVVGSSPAVAHDNVQPCVAFWIGIAWLGVYPVPS